MAGTESGERVTADLEIRKAEAQGNWGIGILSRTAEDPLRAIGRATSPVINARMLASVVALTQQGSIAAVEEGSFMAEVLRSLREKLPLPSPPIPWLRDDLVRTVQCLVTAWPVPCVRSGFRGGGIYTYLYIKWYDPVKSMTRARKCILRLVPIMTLMMVMIIMATMTTMTSVATMPVMIIMVIMATSTEKQTL